jgi:hypothetical protein
MIFRSKVDAWLAAVLVISALACVVAAAAVAFTGGVGAWLIAALIVALGSALPLWLLSSTRYALTATELDVRSGPFRWRVPIGEIRKVAPTRDILSSPALSLDRLRIDYGRSRWIMVSPLDKEGFVRELEARRQGVSR